ncbi:hypothetical protein K1719_017282 [Acacia pycnantha]|nr:hypothetical protein K1719_017282 [Acacia pycnantha]
MAATLIWGSVRELWTPLTLTIHSLTISNKLYKASASRDMFELWVVNGRINTSEFSESEQPPIPREYMDGSDDNVPTTIVEGRFKVEPSIVNSVTNLFNNLMDYARNNNKLLKTNNSKLVSGSQKSLSSFLRQGLKAY